MQDSRHRYIEEQVRADLRERTSIPRFFQVHLGDADHERQGVRILPFPRLCESLALV